MRKRHVFSWSAVVALTLLTLVPQTGVDALAASPGPKTLTGTVPAVVATGKAELRGHRPSSDIVNISVGLPLRNVAQLETFLKDVNDPSSSHYHQFLSQDEANTQFNPTSNDETRVVQWLKKNGLRVTNTFPNHLMVDAQGSASDVEYLFQVSLNQYRATVRGTQHDFFAPDRNPVIDASVSDVVDSVVGLDSVPRISTALSSNGSAHNTTPYYPQDIANAYDVGPLWSGGYTGTGQHIGITMWSVPPSDTTLQHFGSTTGAAVATVANGKLKVIKVCDGSNCTSSVADTGEAGLDIEWTSGIAPGATIDYYQAPTDSSGNPTDPGLLNALNQAGSDSNNNLQITNSWGGCEPTSTSDNFVSQAESIFSSNSTTGHNYFFSSGDNGSWCNPSNGAAGTDPYPDYPTSSPHVTSVGGTTFKASINGSYPGEAAWTYTSGSTPQGSGGGYSAIFGRPLWQTGGGLALNSKRGYPDVSAVADPNTGVYACYGASSACAQFGGTSLSSPLLAGVTALLNQYLTAQSLPHLGFLDPTLYTLSTSTQQFLPFHDITSGTNGQYSAGAGWDAVTGWGAPDAWNVARDLAGTTGSTSTSTLTPTMTVAPTSSPTTIAAPTSTPVATMTPTNTTVATNTPGPTKTPTTPTSTQTATPAPTGTGTSSTASLSANPNPVGVSSGNGTTAISWNTGDGSYGQVYVSPNGGSDILFAQGASGSGTAPWIGAGSSYLFRLYAGTSHTTVLKSITVTTSSSQPASLTSGNNPVQVVSGSGVTTITWNTGDGSYGQVYVSPNGGSDILFAQGASGSGTAPWIGAGSSYLFKLYAGSAHTTVLASVTVSTTSSVLTASPNPVSVSSGNGTTAISWNTGDGSYGQVYVSPNGGSDILFAQGASGSGTAPWIGAGSSYLFTLYAGTGHTTVLAEVNVTTVTSSSVTPTPTSAASCPGSQSGCIQAMLNQINSDRSAAGVAPLTLNSTETNGTASCVGSYGHSVHMSQVGSISHDQFPADICIPYSTAGENVGESSGSNEWTALQSLDSQMMAEPHTASTCSTTNNHACNIINPAFHQVGIGIYFVNNATWLTEDLTN